MYKILSLSGGGVRGYLAAQTLAEIERRSGKKIYEMFDLIVGTSIGGFIGANVQSLPAQYTADLFRHLSPRVFKRNPLGFMGIVQSIYNTNSKNECIKELLNFKQEARTKFGYVAYDIKGRRPVIFNNIEDNTNSSKYLLTTKYSISDAICATTAAPLYWDPYLLDQMILVDGALISNSPVSVGIKLAHNKNISLRDMSIVSIGTGKLTRPYIKTNGGNVISWVRPLINILIDGQSELTNMCYEDEGLDYYSLDIDLLNSNDDIDDISIKNYSNLDIDANRLIKLHSKKIDEICQKF